MPPTLNVSFFLAFLAGLASFLSPCVLPMVPVYLTYLAGDSLSPSGTGPPAVSTALRLRVLKNAVAFVAGFSLVFVVLFGFSAGVTGRLLLALRPVLQRVAGLLVVAFGLHLMGILRLGFLERETRWQPGAGGTAPSVSRSLVLGMAFSAGWTPCVGPILASIFMLAASGATVGSAVSLLAAYAAGLAVPFLVAALFLGSLLPGLKRLQHHFHRIRLASGLLLLTIGVMLFTNYFQNLARWFSWFL